MDWGLAGLLEHFAQKRKRHGRDAERGAPDGSETDNPLQHILDELDPADDDWVELALAVTARAIAQPPPTLCLLVQPALLGAGEDGAGTETLAGQGRGRRGVGQGAEEAVDEALKVFVARALTLLEDCELWAHSMPYHPPHLACPGPCAAESSCTGIAAGPLVGRRCSRRGMHLMRECP